jgi:PHD/YefM family antitoxin component YafN of YafNO toxin-antitoxin module
MKNLTREIDFLSLKNNFNEVCDEVNRGNEAVTLTLKSGRQIFIVPEENYNNISRFVLVSTSSNALTN